MDLSRRDFLKASGGAGLTGTALVRPFADFTALDVVGVVTPNRPGRGAGG